MLSTGVGNWPPSRLAVCLLITVLLYMREWEYNARDEKRYVLDNKEYAPIYRIMTCPPYRISAIPEDH